MKPQHFYDFGPFRLDPAERVLLRDGDPLPVPPKDIETLIYLVERHGHIVEKDELLDKVWAGVFVEEGNLARRISNLRSLLGDGVEGETFIDTVPRRGYRFVAKVKEIKPEPGLPLVVDRIEIVPPPESTSKSHRRLMTAVAVVAIIALASFLAWRYLSSESSRTSNRAMLAVLPFANLTGDSAQEYICDGLTEETITQLGRLNPDRLGVIARTSSMAYKGTSKTVEQIGGELGVDYVLEGSVRGNSGQMRFTVQLIRVRDQTHLWAHEYDRVATDILRVQTDISKVVADEVDFALAPQGKRLAAESSLHAEVYDLYLLGRFYWNKRSRDGLAKAVDYFEQAIAKDPNYAPAYSGVADCLLLQYWISDLPREQTIPGAVAAARRAVELDPSLAEPHASLGILAVMDRHWAEAETEFDRAVTLNSNYPTAHHWNAIRLAAIGRPPDGVAELRRAIALDPLSPILHTDLGWLLILSRSPEPALQELKKSLELDPNFYLAHMYMARAYEVENNYPSAISEMTKAIEISGRKPELLARLGRICGLAGNTEEAGRLLRELDVESRRKPIAPYLPALIYSGLGDREKELALLEKSDVEGNNMEASWIRVDPSYDTVRTDPRFQQILQRNGLQ